MQDRVTVITGLVLAFVLMNILICSYFETHAHRNEDYLITPSIDEWQRMVVDNNVYMYDILYDDNVACIAYIKDYVDMSPELYDARIEFGENGNDIIRHCLGSISLPGWLGVVKNEDHCNLCMSYASGIRCYRDYDMNNVLDSKTEFGISNILKMLHPGSYTDNVKSFCYIEGHWWKMSIDGSLLVMDIYNPEGELIDSRAESLDVGDGNWYSSNMYISGGDVYVVLHGSIDSTGYLYVYDSSTENAIMCSRYELPFLKNAGGSVSMLINDGVVYIAYIDIDQNCINLNACSLNGLSNQNWKTEAIPRKYDLLSISPREVDTRLKIHFDSGVWCLVYPEYRLNGDIIEEHLVCSYRRCVGLNDAMWIQEDINDCFEDSILSSFNTFEISTMGNNLRICYAIGSYGGTKLVLAEKNIGNSCAIQ